jgi:hypothetical protein
MRQAIQPLKIASVPTEALLKQSTSAGADELALIDHTGCSAGSIR